MLKIVVDFRSQDQSYFTKWLKVKLSYMVTSAQRSVTGVTPATAYIWATSQYHDLSQGPVRDAIFNDEIFSTFTKGCGLTYTGSKYQFNTECDDSLSATRPQNDVAIHAYIMGFQYVPDTGKVQK